MGTNKCWRRQANLQSTSISSGVGVRWGARNNPRHSILLNNIIIHAIKLLNVVPFLTLLCFTRKCVKKCKNYTISTQNEQGLKTNYNVNIELSNRTLCLYVIVKPKKWLLQQTGKSSSDMDHF